MSAVPVGKATFNAFKRIINVLLLGSDKFSSTKSYQLSQDELYGSFRRISVYVLREKLLPKGFPPSEHQAISWNIFLNLTNHIIPKKNIPNPFLGKTQLCVSKAITSLNDFESWRNITYRTSALWCLGGQTQIDLLPFIPSFRRITKKFDLFFPTKSSFSVAGFSWSTRLLPSERLSESPSGWSGDSFVMAISFASVVFFGWFVRFSHYVLIVC